MSQTEPWQLFAKLRQEIVRNEAYNACQDVQDKAESRLWIKSKTKEGNEHHESVH